MTKIFQLLKDQGWLGETVNTESEAECPALNPHSEDSDDDDADELLPEDEGEDHRYTLMLSMFIMWSLLYSFIKYCSPKETREYQNRVLVLLHSATLSIVCLYNPFMSVLGFEKHYDFVDWYEVIIAFIWGFFAYDLFWSLSHKENFIYNIYHFVVLGTLSRFMFKEENHDVILNTIGLLAITNTILQVKWFIEKHKMGDTFLHKFLDTCFFSVYFFIRLIMGTQFMYKMLTSDSMVWDDRAILLYGYVMGLFFIHETLDNTKKRYTIDVSHNKRWILLKSELLKDHSIYKLA